MPQAAQTSAAGGGGAADQEALEMLLSLGLDAEEALPTPDEINANAAAPDDYYSGLGYNVRL